MWIRCLSDRRRGQVLKSDIAEGTVSISLPGVLMADPVQVGVPCVSTARAIRRRRQARGILAKLT